MHEFVHDAFMAIMKDMRFVCTLLDVFITNFTLELIWCHELFFLYHRVVVSIVT
jgi:hypothetical protein